MAERRSGAADGLAEGLARFSEWADGHLGLLRVTGPVGRRGSGGGDGDGGDGEG